MKYREHLKYIRKMVKMTTDKIEKAISELLDDNIERISVESITVLHCLFDKEDGKNVFERWLNERPQQEVSLSGIDFDQMYSYVQQRIADSPQNVNDRWGTGRFNRFVFVFQRIAAVLIIPLIISASVLLFNVYSQSSHFEKELYNIINLESENLHLGMEYLSPPGARLNIILPDSSQVCLNGNSRLLLSKTFNNKDRIVRVEGEAFFSVAPDSSKRFIVKAGDVDVTALGTSFYIKAYPSDNRVETVLLTGKVAIDTPDRKAKEGSLFLYPNQKHIYYKTIGRHEPVKEVRVRKYKAWTDGELIFEDESMAQIIDRLENFYNVKIDVKNSEINTYRFTASLKNCSLEQIMEYFKMSSPIDYVIDKNRVILSSIY